MFSDFDDKLFKTDVKFENFDSLNLDYSCGLYDENKLGNTQKYIVGLLGPRDKRYSHLVELESLKSLWKRQCDMWIVKDFIYTNDSFGSLDKENIIRKHEALTGSIEWEHDLNLHGSNIKELVFVGLRDNYLVISSKKFIFCLDNTKGILNWKMERFLGRLLRINENGNSLFGLYRNFIEIDLKSGEFLNDTKDPNLFEDFGNSTRDDYLQIRDYLITTSNRNPNVWLFNTKKMVFDFALKIDEVKGFSNEAILFYENKIFAKDAANTLHVIQKKGEW